MTDAMAGIRLHVDLVSVAWCHRRDVSCIVGDCMRVSFRRRRHQNIAAHVREGWQRQRRVTQAKLERKPDEIQLWINNLLTS